LGERRELAPSGIPSDEHSLAEVQTAEPGAHRDRVAGVVHPVRIGGRESDGHMAEACRIAKVRPYDRHFDEPAVGRPAEATGRRARRPTVGRVSDTIPAQVSELFDPRRWREVEGLDVTDITYHRGGVRRCATLGLRVVALSW